MTCDSHDRAAAVAALALAALVLVLACAPAVYGQTIRPRSAKPIPLINADEEMAGFVRRAVEMIEKKDYAGAIDVLHALLSRSEQCFVRTEDVGRFLPLATKASEVIGQLPEEGLELYRRQFDVPAEMMFLRAAETLDEAELRGLTRRYFHTHYGDKALNLLGAILFDRGEFSQAATCWREILEHYRGSSLDKPALWAKVAVAHHFAGENARADEAAKQLLEQFPDAQGVLAGQKIGVSEFVRKMRTLSPPEAVGRSVQQGWPCLAGAPDSLAVMSPCNPVLAPRWSSLPQSARLEEVATLRGLIGPAMVTNPYDGGRTTPAKPILKEGQVLLQFTAPARATSDPLPSLVHPVVAGKTVLVRAADNIAAYDLLTGEKLWESYKFPLSRETNAPAMPYYGPYGPYGYLNVQDQGRCTLTVADGKAFAVGQFLPGNLPAAYQMSGQPIPKGLTDTSTLEAFSLSSQGSRVWRVGNGEGSADVLRGSKFLCAPTVTGGRAYVVVQYMMAYHLVCLDGENGRLVWSVMVSQTPVPLQPYYQPMYRPDQGSPPAVADGRVYVATNAGVVASFDADTGRALWAYQYETIVEQPGTMYRRAKSGVQMQVGYPPNPVVVAKGRVIVLPADSRQLLALRADTGELLWSTDRRDQCNLTAIDESRMLLSEPNLLVLEAAGGREIWPGARSSPVGNVAGRPAVTTDSVLASGRGELFRLSLADYTLARLGLTSSDGLLGNLVCVDGKLVAANAAGVAAYFTFEESHEELTNRLKSAPEDKVPMLLFQRGMNAFNANRPELALTDLLKARDLGEAGELTALKGMCDQGLYRAYVSMGNKAADDATMLELFKKAEAVAYSASSRGEMLVRLMKYYRKLSQPATAAELAMRLTTELPNAQLVDVEIGPKADPQVRDDPETPRMRGYDLGHAFLKQLIASSGQECYSAFDAKAEAELKSAVAAGDADAAGKVADTYRHSFWAPMALLRASEILYRKALAAEEADRRSPLTKAGLTLGRIYQDYPASGVAASARLGKALIYENLKFPAMVKRSLRAIQDLPAETRLAFADVSGTRDQILTRFHADVRPTVKPDVDRLEAPLVKCFSDEPGLILRDSEGQPVRSGDCLFLLQGARLSMFDPVAAKAGDPLSGVRWKASVPDDLARMYQFGYQGPGFSLVAGLSEDGGTLVFCSRGGFMGMDVKTGKISWRRQASDASITNLNAMTVGEGQVVSVTHQAGIEAIDIVTGKTTWRENLLQSRQPQPRGVPQINAGMLLVPHGQSESFGTLFDLGASKKTLGSVKMAAWNAPQFVLTGDGLVLGCDGRGVRLVEPLLGIDQPIWSQPLQPNLQPAVLTMGESHVIVAPEMNRNVVQVRAGDDGAVNRTLELASCDGRTMLPHSAWIVGDRLYVLAGSQPNHNRFNSPYQRLSWAIDPVIEAFDLSSGALCWKQSIAPQNNMQFLVSVSFTRKYLAAAVRDSGSGRPGALQLIDLETGKLAQAGLELPVVVNPPQPMGQFHLMAMGGAVAVKDRLVVETSKGIDVYTAKSKAATNATKE